MIEEIYKLLDKYNIIYPDGHDLFIYDTVTKIIFTPDNFTDVSDGVLMLGYCGVATAAIEVSNSRAKITIGRMTHRYTYSQVGELFYLDDYKFMDVDHGVKQWNEFVKKQYNLNLLVNKI